MFVSSVLTDPFRDLLVCTNIDYVERGQISIPVTPGLSSCAVTHTHNYTFRGLLGAHRVEGCVEP